MAGRPIELKPLDSEPPPSLPVVELQEDGRFRIGDLHDSAWCAPGSYSNGGLRRAHSTGDLKGADEPPRYHLDSDHSSQHEDKPEELAGRALARAGRHLLLLQSSTVSRNLLFCFKILHLVKLKFKINHFHIKIENT